MAEVVAYQGEPGAYSEEAAHRLFPGASLLPLRTLHQVFDKVAGGDLRAGVVPLENSQAGSINETYDLLARGEVHIVGEAVTRVDHALLALPGIPLGYVKRVASHPAALAQCQEFLATLDEEVEIVPVYDTAGAAKRIAEEKRAGEAAVASERAAQVYGLEVLASRIQDTPDNFTRFAAVATDPEPLGPPDKTSLVLITDHRPGALFHALRPFAERGCEPRQAGVAAVGFRPVEVPFLSRRRGRGARAGLPCGAGGPPDRGRRGAGARLLRAVARTRTTATAREGPRMEHRELRGPPKGPGRGRQEEPYASPQRPVPIRLNTNECPYPLPQGFAQDLQQTVARLSLNRYPDWEAVELRGLLAQRTGWPVEGLVVANGSNEIIQQLLLRLRRAGPAGGDVRADLSGLLASGVGDAHRGDARPGGAAVRHRRRAVDRARGRRPARGLRLFAEQPHRNTQPVEVVERLPHRRALVVVDEAYIEFGGKTAAMDLDIENVAVLRTFSKAFALAGARLGYGLVSDAVAADVSGCGCRTTCPR